MGEDQNPIFCFKNQNLKFDEGRYEKEVKWVAAMEVNGSLEDLCGSESNANEESSLLEEDSADSGGSLCFSSDMADQEDASSSSSSSSSRLMCSSSSSSSASLTNNQGPLYELSDLMAQLPMKRGLSKFYDGRSQSFTSLAGVRSLEDLVKKERPYNKRLKLCRSYGGGLDIGQSNKAYSPRAIISKKVSNRGSSFLSSLGKRSPNSIATRPPVPVIRT